MSDRREEWGFWDILSEDLFRHLYCDDPWNLGGDEPLAAGELEDHPYVNPNAAYFRWTPVDEQLYQPYSTDWKIGAYGRGSGVAELIHFAVLDIHYAFESQGPPHIYLEDVSMADLCLIDAAYGIVVQEWAKHPEENEEGVLAIPKLTIVSGCDTVATAIRWHEYLTWLQTSGLDVVYSNPAWLAHVVRTSGVDMFEIRLMLNFLRVAANVDLLYENADQGAHLQSQVNLDCGYAGHMGWHRLTKLLSHQGYIPQDKELRLERPPEQFAAAISVLDTLLHFLEKIVTPDVHDNLQEVSRWNEIYI